MGVKRKTSSQRIVKKYEIRRRSLQAVKINSALSSNLHWEAQKTIQSYPRETSITRFFRYCIITGRSRSVNRFYRLSRHAMKKAVVNLPGVRKW